MRKKKERLFSQEEFVNLMKGFEIVPKDIKIASTPMGGLAIINNLNQSLTVSKEDQDYSFNVDILNSRFDDYIINYNDGSKYIYRKINKPKAGMLCFVTHCDGFEHSKEISNYVFYLTNEIYCYWLYDERIKRYNIATSNSEYLNYYQIKQKEKNQ